MSLLSIFSDGLISLACSVLKIEVRGSFNYVEKLPQFYKYSNFNNTVFKLVKQAAVDKTMVSKETAVFIKYFAIKRGLSGIYSLVGRLVN